PELRGNRPCLGGRDEPGRRAGRGDRLHVRAAVRGRGAGRVEHADPDEEEPPRRAAERDLLAGVPASGRGHPVPRNRHVRRPPRADDPPEAAARGVYDRDAVGPGPRQARLARRAERGNTGVRGLRPHRPRTRRATPRGLQGSNERLTTTKDTKYT